MGIMASLHAEKGILQPIWPRVTTTPFHCRCRAAYIVGTTPALVYMSLMRDSLDVQTPGVAGQWP